MTETKIPSNEDLVKTAFMLSEEEAADYLESNFEIEIHVSELKALMSQARAAGRAEGAAEQKKEVEKLKVYIKELDPYNRGVVKTSEDF